MKHFSTVCLLAALASTSGCGMSGPPKHLEPTQDTKQWGNPKIIAPSLDSPAVLVKSEDGIDKSKFVEVGHPYFAILKKACFRGRCKNYDSDRSLLPEILELTADIGGTHLVLEQQNFVKKDRVKRDTDRCAVDDVGDVGGHYTNYDAGGNYTPGRGVWVQKKGNCIQWATESGTGEYVGLRGTAWRYAPEAAATLRKMNNFAVPYIVRDKKTGKCSYVEPLFNTAVEAGRDVCFPYFWFEDKISRYPTEASYYALASSKSRASSDGKIHWVLLNLFGYEMRVLFGEGPSCAQNDIKCVEKYVKSKFRKGEFHL